MPSIPDLVRVSKLDTQFCANLEYTQHIEYVAESTSQRRGVRKEERWEKDRELGRGSYGVVWLEQCIHGDSEGKVRAVKKIQKLHCNNYHRELEAVALFSHKKYERCFVKSFGWYDDDDSIYITKEYLPNGDLHQHLVSPLPESEGQSIVFQVLEGLHYMHQNGFAHRDLKPANILVVCKHPEWWVKIADFGISKRATEGLTTLRTLIGTPAFTAPEVLGFIQSESYTDAVDIWALGVIAFLILTGETLFKDQRLLGQYVRGSFTFPFEILVSNKVSKEGCEFFKSLMAPKSQDRPGAGESLKTPWLACLAEPAFSQIQKSRTMAVSKIQENQYFHSDNEASASWSTQDQSSVHISDNSTDMLARRANLNPPASFSTQDKASPSKLHSRESELSPSTPIPESRSEASIKVHWKKRRPLKGHSLGVEAVVFSPNGKLIASASSDGTVRLWNTTTRTVRSKIKGHLEPVMAVTFSPDGKLIASASRDWTVRLWDSATGKSRAELQGHSEPVMGVVFSPDGKLIASASWDGMVRLWDSTTGAARAKFHSNPVNAVAFSPDGKLIASALSDWTVKLWDLATGTTCAELQGHSKSVTAVAYSPDGRLITSASWDGTVRLWDSATGEARAVLHGHSRSVMAVTFSPDGKLIASASMDRTVRLWDSATGAALAELQGHSESVMAVAFSPDGKLIASTSWDWKVRLWESTTKVDKNNIAIKYFRKFLK